MYRPRLVATLLLALACTTGAARSECDCAGDLNGDGVTDGADLGILLAAWGSRGAADLDGSGLIDGADLGLLLAAWGACPTPSNDVCPGNAQTIYGLWEASVPFCNTAATTDTLPLPAYICGNNVAMGKDLWFSRQVSGPGKLRISTCDSDFDTVLAVYRNASAPDRCLCPPAEFVNLIGCNDDSSVCGFQSFLEVDVGDIDCVLIRVGGYAYASGHVSSGSGVLHVKEILRGDRCDVAHQLPSQISVSAYGNTLGDTWLEGDQTLCTSNDVYDEWYRYEMPCDGTLTVSTCNPDTGFDTSLAVFSGCGGAQIACNDDSSDEGCQIDGLHRKSKVTLSATAGEVLLIRVSGWNGAAGFFGLSLHASCIQ